MATTATITLPEAVLQAHSVVPPGMRLEDIIMAPEGLAAPMDLLVTTALTLTLVITLTVVPQVVSELLPQALLALTVQANLVALVVRLETITLLLLLMSTEALVLHLVPPLMVPLALGVGLDMEDTVHSLDHRKVSDVMDLDMDLEDTVRKVLGTTALLTAQ